MIQVITNYSISEMLLYPNDYVDSYEDIVLLKVFGEDVTNPIILMLGFDDKAESYYFVVEDNEVSEDIYCKANKLPEVYDRIMIDLLKEGAIQDGTVLYACN